MATAHIALKPIPAEDARVTQGTSTLLYCGFQLHDAASQEPSLHIHDDIMMPSTRLPAIPSNMIKYVTYVGSIEAGFRPDGVYRQGRAILEAKMDTNRFGRAQTISIRAPGIKSARSIYDQVRQGNLEPTRRWSDKPAEVAEA